MFSAQTWTRSPRDTLFIIERVTPHPDPNKPQIEAQLELCLPRGDGLQFEVVDVIQQMRRDRVRFGGQVVHDEVGIEFLLRLGLLGGLCGMDSVATLSRGAGAL